MNPNFQVFVTIADLLGCS